MPRGGGYGWVGARGGSGVRINPHCYQFAKPQAFFEPPKYEVDIRVISIAYGEE